MPAYFFDVERRGDRVRDERGTELVGREEVPDQAAAMLVDVIRDGVRRGDPPAGDGARYAVVVRDAAGSDVYRADAALFDEDPLGSDPAGGGAIMPSLTRDGPGMRARPRLASRFRFDAGPTGSTSPVVSARPGAAPAPDHPAPCRRRPASARPRRGRRCGPRGSPRGD